ncbi:hypothetical protein TNIN_3811 [Trichonephila inaurata madagascariensis]|uniref:Uncharacterized protein n=1 Tax=Trichonephila inaurata madagascariensis TaxID=2747483 RepID=A0A8X6XYB3_9ARAC|nr:hypothetical protein TNIN_3811 [Trichonephila inaurata madagascariensis]
MPDINLQEGISEISKAWNYDVTDCTIHNSFAKAGFFSSSKSSAGRKEGKFGGQRQYSLIRNEKNMDTAKGKTRDYG